MNDALLRTAYSLHQTGKLIEAAQLYDEVLKTEPRRFDALYPLGLSYIQRGQFAEAERILGKAARANAAVAEPHAARGTALSQLGRHEDALAAYDRAIALKPDQSSIWSNRGNALIQLGRPEEAVASYDRSLAIKADQPGAWRHRALALSVLNRGEEALANLDKALTLKNDYSDALEDKANLLMRLQRHADAASAFARAIAVRPGNPHLHYNRANVLSILKSYDEAIEECRKTLALQPDYPYARGVLVHAMLQICDWPALEEEKSKISAGLKAGKRAVSPFNHKALSDSPEEQLQCARVWVANEKPAGLKPFPHRPQKHDRIRLAYVSADFNLSAVATLMAGVFEHHDRTRFETTAISFGSQAQTPMRARLEKAFDRFLDMRAKSDAYIAQTMRDLEIDIAIDLMGYTGECRSWILARRPAPVQVNFLGFPGTMGADHIDYTLADKVVIPESAQAHYAEKIAYLPDCYLPNDSTRAIAAKPPARGDAGLPEQGFVLASFNNTYKFNRDIFDIWMRLLRAREDSVLWLASCHPSAAANLACEAEAHGVAPTRLVFAEPVIDPAQHLARLRLADLFLDTAPYNAHSTAIDALWAGLPVLTAPGNSFQSRVAASLLTALGLPELIAPSSADYEALALRLATEPGVLTGIREKLVRQRSHAPLFDTARFTRNIEAAYAAMWERHQRGEPPASFAVAPS